MTTTNFIFKPKELPLEVLKSAPPIGLDEGELGIVSESGQFVKRPDGDPNANLIFLTASRTTSAREIEEVLTVSETNIIPDALFNIYPDSLKIKVNGLDEYEGFAEEGGKSVSWAPAGLYDLEPGFKVTLLYNIDLES